MVFTYSAILTRSYPQYPSFESTRNLSAILFAYCSRDHQPLEIASEEERERSGIKFG